MNHTIRTSTSDQTTSTTTTNRLTNQARTEDYSRRRNTSHKQQIQAPRSNASHHGIVINWGGASCGRPAPTFRAVNHAVDLPVAVSALGWP